MQGAEVVGKQGHLRLRLADADAGSEAAKQAAALVFPVAQPIFVRVNQRLKAEGKPEIRHGNTGTDEVVRRNADYGKGDAVETDGFAQHRGISGKPLLPVVFADEDGGRGRELEILHGSKVRPRKAATPRT